ncbi:MAG: GxxExxY protein [Planctomycetota bacterium]
MTDKNDEFLYKDLTYKVIGIAMEIHRELQSGFLEAVYEEVMRKELEKAKIPFENQVKVDIYYKEEKLDKQYQADFIIDKKVLVELKGINKITDIERAQVINYLKATGLKVGLIINFGSKSLEWERIIY